MNSSKQRINENACLTIGRVHRLLTEHMNRNLKLIKKYVQVEVDTLRERLSTSTSDWVNLETHHESFRFDIVYAKEQNFLGKKAYKIPGAFLRRPVVQDLEKAHAMLKPLGFGVLFYDGYRPWSVTKLFWDDVPNMREFLADPIKGSVHNKGCAVDVTLYDLKTGKAVDMPSEFDEPTSRSYVEYADGTIEQTQNRDLLQSVMKTAGFKGISNEWWHFNHPSAAQYPFVNHSFDVLKRISLRDQ